MKRKTDDKVAMVLIGSFTLLGFFGFLAFLCISKPQGYMPAPTTQYVSLRDVDEAKILFKRSRENE